VRYPWSSTTDPFPSPPHAPNTLGDHSILMIASQRKGLGWKPARAMGACPLCGKSLTVDLAPGRIAVAH